MACKVTNCYIERFPKLRLIGKKYTHDERVNGWFGEQWNVWLKNGWFRFLEKYAKYADESNKGPLGLVVVNPNTKEYVYWIGLLFPPDTNPPEGFSYIDLPEARIGIVWVYGSDHTNEIFGKVAIEMASDHLINEGKGKPSTNVLGPGTLIFFERYNIPRYTNPDEKGNVILDYGFYLENR